LAKLLKPEFALLNNSNFMAVFLILTVFNRVNEDLEK